MPYSNDVYVLIYDYSDGVQVEVFSNLQRSKEFAEEIRKENNLNDGEPLDWKRDDNDWQWWDERGDISFLIARRPVYRGNS